MRKNEETWKLIHLSKGIFDVAVFIFSPDLSFMKSHLPGVV